MKLYFSPGACSQAAHIALQEAGAAFTLDKVDLKNKTTASGVDFRKINPYGYVPALELADGSTLSEGVAILQYIADTFPAARLAPPNGSWDRYRLQAYLTLINSELHKTIGGLFAPGLSEEQKTAIIHKADARLKVLSEDLGERPYLLGEHFSVADAYLFVVFGWFNHFKVDLNRWPVIAAHFARVAARPAVQAALAAEFAKPGAGDKAA